MENICNTISLSSYPRDTLKAINYGTAGFRSKSSELDSVAFRMGLLAALRSSTKDGKVVGLMITASHNPEDDNGIKLIDPNGEMLSSDWELIANELANAVDSDIDQIWARLKSQFSKSSSSTVFIARDTRPSSLRLSTAAKAGIKFVGGMANDFGLLTTPQLHYLVYCFNNPGLYGEPTEIGYYQKLSKAFVTLNDSRTNQFPELYLDCANGVGAGKMSQLLAYIGDEQPFKITFFNAGDGTLNYLCGADYVKMSQKLPSGLDCQPNIRCASFDGDADRVVYYYTDASQKLHLIDGDKIATLFLMYLKKLVTACKIESQLDFCCVQTAYANGSSTSYIEQVLKVPVVCVPTGVKHLHRRAQNADIGVYFEANGHGTVLFSQKCTELVKSLVAKSNSDAIYFKCFIDLINQTTGDAISDLLVVETILSCTGLSIEEWDRMYTDLPNRQLKVVVQDRSVIKMNSDERSCTAPSGFQEQIDMIVSKYGSKARAFVRPSGTEDVVRVYAENEDQTTADSLAKDVANLVSTFFN